MKSIKFVEIVNYMIRLKSTYTPEDVKTEPTNKLTMGDILEYWGQEDNHIDISQYLRVIRAKLFTK